MTKIKYRERIEAWQITRRTMICLSLIFSTMAVEQQAALLCLPRPADLLYEPGGKEHFTSFEICSVQNGKADGLL